jgi:hypothetical protein
MLNAGAQHTHPLRRGQQRGFAVNLLKSSCTPVILIVHLPFINKWERVEPR